MVSKKITILRSSKENDAPIRIGKNCQPEKTHDIITLWFSEVVNDHANYQLINYLYYILMPIVPVYYWYVYSI